MNAPLVLAGCLAVVGTGIHGIAGERLVIRKLDEPPALRTMIHVTWHLTTAAFLTVGLALIAAGSLLEGDRADGVAVLGATALTAFAAVTLGISVAHARSARLLLRHPGPGLLTATAALAWWGAL